MILSSEWFIWVHFWILQAWRWVSRGCFLPICLSFLPPFLKARKCPTSPPVSPLTHPWWWATCLLIIHQFINVHEVIMNSIIPSFSWVYVCACVCVCVHIRSWGQWVLFWNVWTGGEWEWSWKTAVLEFLSYSSTPTHCNTHMRVRAHTHTHGGCYHMFSIMRTLKEFCQWRMLSFCSVFSLLMSVKQAAVGCVCGIMISWYIYIYCITSSLFSLFLFIFAPVHSYLPTNQICSMWCRICHERKMLLLWNVLCFSPN